MAHRRSPLYFGDMLMLQIAGGVLLAIIGWWILGKVVDWFQGY